MKCGLQWSMPGSVLVTGGLGALGSLVAAWLATLASSPHAPGLTLLGRSGRAADAQAAQILATCQTQVKSAFTHLDSQPGQPYKSAQVSPALGYSGFAARWMFCRNAGAAEPC